MEKRLEQIEKELKEQRKGIQGATAIPIRHLKETDIVWLISTVKEQAKKLHEVKGKNNKLITELEQAKETIEKYKIAIEQSLRNFDHGNRLDGLLALKQALEGEEQ